jgi:hypothetical protein
MNPIGKAREVETGDGAPTTAEAQGAGSVSVGDDFSVVVVSTDELVDDEGNSVDFDEFLGWRDEGIRAMRIGGSGTGTLPLVTMDYERSRLFDDRLQDAIFGTAGRLLAL